MTEQRDTEQISASLESAIDERVASALLNVHTMMPGFIVSFNPDTQTAQVQPAIKRIFIEQGPVNLPVCVDVLVAFPGGGDWFLTFPVKAGDECTLNFSERAIDYWFANGGVQLPAEYRLHDLSDAIATVGINSLPKKLGNFRMNSVQLRSRTGEFYIEIDNDGKMRVQAEHIEAHATKSWGWDAGGFGERWTHLGGSNWEHKTWQVGATIVPVVLNINPPEGP